MKRLRFIELLLLSDVEHRAKSVKFHEKVTVIKGENGRGKSCLLKSLYAALGAMPRKQHPTWTRLNVTLLLYFRIDGDDYSILKSGRRFTVFDRDSKVIKICDGASTELSDFIAEMFDFRLELTHSKTRIPQRATSAFLFLPFYVDQDAGWLENWSSFDGLKQFSNYRAAVSAYHAGIQPNEYYEARSLRAKSVIEREKLQSERDGIQRIWSRLEGVLTSLNVDTNIVSFEREMERLVLEMNRVQQVEHKLRDEVIAMENRRASILHQIDIATAAATELSKDFSFVADELPDEVECPVCGTKHRNSFAERFGIALDEDYIRNLLVELTNELSDSERMILVRKDKAAELQRRSTAIAELLELEMNEVNLQDVLRSEGTKEVRVVLRSEILAVDRQLVAAQMEIDRASRAMKTAYNRKRAARIKEHYREIMSRYLFRLRVMTILESSYKEMHYQVKETGSALPRALLAFYFAFISTAEQFSTTTMCPIVLDSPKQQDQDDGNWPLMLQFIRECLPKDSQLVLSLVDDAGVDFGGTIVNVNNVEGLLAASEYPEVAERLRPYLDASLK